MFRIIGGVILGFITLFVVTFFTFSGLFLALGSNGAFHAGNFEVTAPWLVGSLVLGFIAAVLAGKVCSTVTAKPGPVVVLAALVLILDLFAAFNPPQDRRTERAGEVSMTDAIVNAREPTWFVFLMPLVATAGVILGGRQRRASSFTPKA